MAISFGKNENDTMCGVVRMEAQLLQEYITIYKIQNISSSSAAPCCVYVCVCEPCARFGEGRAATAFRSFVRVIIITTSNYLVLSFWGLNDKWCEIRQCQSQTVTLPRKLFSLFAPRWKSMYARWLLLPLNIHMYINIVRKRRSAKRRIRTRTEQWKEESDANVDSVRLCENCERRWWHTLDAQTDSELPVLMPTKQPTLCRVDFYKLHFFFRAAQSLCPALYPTINSLESNYTRSFWRIFGERNARALECKSNFLREIGFFFIIFTLCFSV